MITRDVLELGARALLTDSRLVLSRVAPVPLLLRTTRLFGVQATFSSCLLEYVDVLFLVLGDAKNDPVRVDIDLVQPVLWWRSILSGTSIPALASTALIECVQSCRYAHSLTHRAFPSKYS